MPQEALPQDDVLQSKQLLFSLSAALLTGSPFGISLALEGIDVDHTRSHWTHKADNM
jgi:hypothetical protein